MTDPLDPLLLRSEALYFAISDLLAKSRVNTDPKSVLTATYADISLEHGQSLLVLVAHGNLNTAQAILRMQLDLVVKALWVYYAAPAGRIEALYAALVNGSLKEPNNLPGISEMLESVAEKGPPAVGELLAAFKSAAWQPLSSYIHGGIHALHQRHRALPSNYATDTLRNSNGLSIQATMMFAIAASGSLPPGAIANLQLRFMDVGPSMAPQSRPT
jgi:hypothetical protein